MLLYHFIVAVNLIERDMVGSQPMLLLYFCANFGDAALKLYSNQITFARERK